MVVDTSAVVAILFGEHDASFFEEALSRADEKLMSAATWVELSIVIEAQYGDAGSRELDLLIKKVGIEIVAFTAEQAELAREAFRNFGKGRHPAALNYGDCFSYALARISGEPLLFKGEDFRRTDLEAVHLDAG